MNGNIDIITLIALVVAIFAVFKLRSVLGRRTGDEENRIDRYRSEQRQRGEPATAQDNVVTLPRREGGQPDHGEVPEGLSRQAIRERVSDFAGSNEELEKGLMEIVDRDSAFEPNNFLQGAKQAYEMIVTAFAEGNRRMLRDLLAPEVYEGFEAAITDRESRSEQVDQSFVGIEKADLLEAGVQDGAALITVKFASQLISATRDKDGEVVSGDPQRVIDVTDIWTFVRDVSTPRAIANPNWQLAATQSAQ